MNNILHLHSGLVEESWDIKIIIKRLQTWLKRSSVHTSKALSMACMNMMTMTITTTITLMWQPASSSGRSSTAPRTSLPQLHWPPWYLSLLFVIFVSITQYWLYSNNALKSMSSKCAMLAFFLQFVTFSYFYLYLYLYFSRKSTLMSSKCAILASAVAVSLESFSIFFLIASMVLKRSQKLFSLYLLLLFYIYLLSYIFFLIRSMVLQIFSLYV